MTAGAEPNLTYASYLHLDALLNAQQPVAPDDAGAEVRDTSS
jgi:tryptophan 2,3-dioxygenase